MSTTSISFIDELVELSSLSFTLYSEYYKCDLVNLYIDQAKEWLYKQSIHPTKRSQLKRYSELSRWVYLASEYKKILNLFYPPTGSRSQTFIEDIKASGYLLDSKITTLKEYWFLKISSNTPKTFRELLDFGRITTQLGLNNKPYNLDCNEFSQVFDLELNYGYSTLTMDTFFALFDYLKEASINPNWQYTKYEWPILSKSVSIWKSWHLCSSVGLDTVSYLLDKYLEIKSIHSLFIDWIWINPHKDITIETDWFEDNDSNYIKPKNPTLDYALNILELGSNFSYDNAKVKYKQLMKIYHPDLNPSSVTKAQEINDAWAIIKKYVRDYES